MKRTLAVFTATLLAGLLAPLPSSAQSSDSGPALGVARISLTNGDVTTKRGDSGDWVAASVNSALVEGDIVETGPGARVEIQLDYSNLIRLDGSSTLELAELGDRRFRVRLLDGRATYSELRNGEADVDIETPFVAVRPRKNGRYEVETRPSETVVQVRRGEAEVASPEGTRTIGKGDMLVIRQTEDGEMAMRKEHAEPAGEWDEWNQRRDDRLSKSESYRYVSRSVTGADDLDDYGDWTYVSGYGHCWYPRVAAGWSPYRHGRWVWIDYYGWSWVGYEPWGWAPYHYGRWFHHPGHGWGWWPGHVQQSYHWRPGLVAFFGYSGRNFSLGVGFGYGNVGWVPLAPYETYHPWYGHGGHGRFGGNRVNNTIIVDNSVNIYNDYRNARVNNGVTVVDANGFSRGQLNNPRSLRGEELQRASLMRGQIPVVPERGSLGQVVNRSARQDSVAARSAGVRTFSRSGDTRTANARPVRGSFDEQRNQIATSVRSFSANRESTPSNGVRGNSVRSGSPSTARSDLTPSTGARSTGSVRSTASDRGFRRAGEPAGASDDSLRTPSSLSRTPGADASSSRVDRGGTVRSSSRGAVSSGRSAESATRGLPERSTSRVDRGSSSSGERRASEPLVRSRTGSSRVDRSSSSSGESRGSRVVRSRAGTDSPFSGESRVDRSAGSPSRVSRSESSSRGERRSSPAMQPRSSVSPSSGASRVERSSPSRARSSFPSSGSSSGRAPSMSAPSRSSGPSMRSAPTGGGSMGRSGGGMSRPSSSGGGGGGGGVRSSSGGRQSGRGR